MTRRSFASIGATITPDKISITLSKRYVVEEKGGAFLKI